MIRNLKITVAAALALAALGAIGVTSAQGKVGEFHCSVEPCTLTLKTDGTSKTAHHVLLFEQGANTLSFTCEGLKGEATLTKSTATEATFKNLEYEQNCQAQGQAVKVRMNGCDYLIKSANVELGNTATLDIVCPEGSKIEIEIPEVGCALKIGSQSGLNHLIFHDALTNGVPKTELTIETTIPGIVASIESETCPGLKKGAATVNYATGNLEVTAENDNLLKEHKSVWFE